MRAVNVLCGRTTPAFTKLSEASIDNPATGIGRFSTLQCWQSLIPSFPGGVAKD